MPDTIPAPEAPLSRFEAQRKLGLFAAHDIVMFSFIVLCLAANLISLAGFALFRWDVNWMKMLLVFNLALVLGVAWLVVLVYRILVFILDLHAEVALMPEAAARIAAGYFEGRKPSK